MKGSVNVPGASGADLEAVRALANNALDTANEALANAGGGCVLEFTFDEGFVGYEYTVTDGADDTYTGIVPESLTANVSVKNVDTVYTVSCTVDGVEYSDTITTGPYYGQQTISFNMFSATISVTAATGARVTATIGSNTFAAPADSSGVATISVGKAGTYTISATKSGATSSTTTATISADGDTVTATVTFITLALTTPTGSAITLSDGTTTLTGTSTGTDTFYLPNTGTWTANISLDGETASDSITVTEYRAYTLSIAYVHIYGVAWDGSSGTSWTRTDEAAGFTDPVPYMSGISNYGSPFDNLLPWSGMVKEERTGGTMVKIPKFWYKLSANGTGLKVQIADKATAGFVAAPLFMDRGDGKGERDYAYVGRYHCADDYKSKTGVKPKVNITRSAARSGIHALGTNIWQMDKAARFTLWLLYLVEFANWNSQATIGYGCGNNSAVENMGYTDSMPYHTGTTKNSRSTYGVSTQYRYIEGLWDNCYDWMDGCYYNSNGMYTILNPANFSDTSGGSLTGLPTSGWPSKFTISSAGGYPEFYPTESSGSESTYSCDSWGFYASYPCLYVGGGYSQNQNHGLVFVGCTAATDSSAYRGARLIELP